MFGYEDALSKPAGGVREWFVPDVLGFILKAAADSEKRPHILVLDEMNLAHVERYFADLLSGLESAKPVIPDLERKEDAWRVKSTGAKQQLPSNLFLIGTVNVDETTYMFSPKVLDRANTIEFRVSTESLPTDVMSLRRPTPCAPGPDGLVKALSVAANSNDVHIEAPPPFLGEFWGEVRLLHEMLFEEGFEFAHRTSHEAVRLATLLSNAGEVSVNVALDVFVMQKVLPRLHGTRKRLEPVLRALQAYAFDRRKPKATGELGPFTGPALLPLSFEKISRMLREASVTQFVAYFG